MTEEKLLVVNRIAHSDEQPATPDYQVELPYDLRKKSRLRVNSLCGLAIGVQLPRGSELLDRQCLVSEQGDFVQVLAATETVSTVSGPNPLQLARAAYHLGNRHVPLQISETWLRYQHDHVLDDMVRGLGLTVTVDKAPFQPESGAYHRGGEGGHHHHHDDDGHGHHHHSDHHHDQ